MSNMLVTCMTKKPVGCGLCVADLLASQNGTPVQILPRCDILLLSHGKESSLRTRCQDIGPLLTRGHVTRFSRERHKCTLSARNSGSWCSNWKPIFYLLVALSVASTIMTADARVCTPLCQVYELWAFGSACGEKQSFEHHVLRYYPKERLKPLQSMLAAGMSKEY